MASPYVREKLAKQLLKKISAQQNRNNRNALQGTRPHVLFLENLDFINKTIGQLLSRGHVKRVKEVTDINDNLQAARDIAKEYHKDYLKVGKKYKTGATDLQNTPAGRLLERKYPKVYAQVLAGEAFLFKNYNGIAECKKKIVDLVLEDVISEANRSKIKARIDRGHGAGDGFAISGVTGATALGAADKALEEDDMRGMLADLKKFGKDLLEEGEIKLTQDALDDIERISVEYKQIVTASGEITAYYIPIVTFQDKYTNRVTDAARERQVLKVMRLYFKTAGAEYLANLEGSSTLIQKAGAIAIKPLLEVKNGEIKISAEIDPRKIKFKTKGNATAQSSKKGKSGSLKRKKAKARGVAAGEVTQAKQTTYSVASLLGLFNAKISKQVLNNMEAPALENRTGRFASSVYVTDIIKTPKGFPSIGYTYDRNPYGVYESTSGSRFASPQRDPRILIDKSIREIAAQLAIGRLYTRRV